MAITLKFCITESDNAKSFTVQETTGIYDAILNPTGWGAPNPTIASALTATITISQLTDSATGTYTTPVVINVFPTLPNTTNTLVEITAEQAGYGTDAQFPDGIYQIIYTVTSSLSSIDPVTQFKGFYSLLDCCIKQASDKLSICTCNCSSLEEEARTLSFWRRELKAADCCSSVNAIMKFIEKITKLCSNCPNC